MNARIVRGAGEYKVVCDGVTLGGFNTLSYALSVRVALYSLDYNLVESLEYINIRYQSLLTTR